MKALDAGLSSYQSAAQELFGRKNRLTPSEVTQTFQGTKLITSFEEFTEYTKGYLDDDALQYVKEVMNHDADDIAKLKKIAQLVEDGSKKIGKKLSKEELKAGLDAFWDDAGVEGALAAIERVFKGGFDNPKTFLQRALKNQQLEDVPAKMKEIWLEGDYKYTVRIHEGNPMYTEAKSVYRVARKSIILNENGQGNGMEYLGTDGNWYHESILSEFFRGGAPNPNFNETAARITHIPINGGN